MPITVVFAPPLPSDSPEVFNSKAFSTLGDLNNWSTEANALASDVTAKQTTASNAATTATTQADLADSSRIAAQAAEAAAAASYDAFDDRNLGAKASDPTQDNDGNALLEGALYWNTTVKEWRTWNGTAWVTTSVANAVSRGGDTMTGPLSVPALNGGQLAGMRNKIINGAFGINQRGYGSGAATTAGQYTLDRWKVTGTGGITFSTTNNKTTVTIPSDQTLQQVIEGLNLQTGTYVLSWEGTAQGRIAGGAYGASGAVTASITGGTNTTIEFNSGTVANVQLELGTIATPFEHRLDEMQHCRRYCIDLVDPPLRGLVLAGTGPAGLGFLLPVEMAAPPSITVVSNFGIIDGENGSGTVTGVASSQNTKNSVSFTPTYTVITAFTTAGRPVIMNTGSSGSIRLTAEL